LQPTRPELGITAAPLSLAWLLHQDENIISIPGTRNRARVTENPDAADIVLNPETVRKISDLAAPGLAQGQTRCCDDGNQKPSLIK